MILIGVIMLINLFFYKNRNKLLFGVNFLILLVYAGYRGIDVGTDTLNYSYHFDLVSSGIVLSHEYLWYVLNKVVYLSGGTFQTVLIVSSVLTLFPVFYVSYKRSPYPILSIFFYVVLYYYFYSFNIIRQCIAMSFCLLSFYLLDEEKEIKAYVVFALSILFHTSSIIALPALVLIKKKIYINNNLSYLILVISFGVGLFFGGSVTGLMQKFLYSNYSIDKEFNLLGTSLLLVIINGFYFFISSMVRDRNNWFTLYFLFILFSNLTVRIPFANRFVFYYGITLIIFYPLFLNENKLSYKFQMILLILLIGYALTNLYTLWGRGEILPYNNVLF